MHEKAALRGGLYCLYFYLEECLICSMSCRDGFFGEMLLVFGCFSLINLTQLKKTVFIFLIVKLCIENQYGVKGAEVKKG